MLESKKTESRLQRDRNRYAWLQIDDNKEGLEVQLINSGKIGRRLRKKSSRRVELYENRALYHLSYSQRLFSSWTK